MGDIILISRLRECLVNSDVSRTDDIEYIRSLITAPLTITSHEQLKTLNNQPIWFYRLILNLRIILFNGVHRSRQKAQKLAYRKMVELMTNKHGVEPKIISNGLCKVVVRKCVSPKRHSKTAATDYDDE